MSQDKNKKNIKDSSSDTESQQDSNERPQKAVKKISGVAS